MYMAFFFAISGCSSIKYNMKVLVKFCSSKSSKLHPYNSISNHGSSYDNMVFSGIEEPKKMVSKDKICKKKPKYFQDAMQQLEGLRSRLKEYCNYISIYKVLNSYNSNQFPLECFKEIKENLLLIDKQIEECKNYINSQSIEFYCFSQIIDKKEKNIQEEIKIKSYENLKLINFYIQYVRYKELLINKKKELYDKLNELNNSKKINKIISIHNRKYLKSELSGLEKEVRDTFKKVLDLFIKVKEIEQKERKNILKDNPHFDTQILEISDIEEDIQQKIKKIEEDLNKISCLSAISYLKQISRLICPTQVNNFDGYMEAMLHSLDIPYGEEIFSKALLCRSLLVAKQVIETCNTLSYNSFLSHLANNILQDKKNNKANNLEIDWTIFKTLLYKNKININEKFSQEGFQKPITMLDLFLENNDIDSASKLIAYSSINFNKDTYPDLIKLLHNSTSQNSLIALFKRLIEANNYFDEHNTKDIYKFLEYIEKNKKCFCIVKKSNDAPPSPYPSPYPSPPPSPPDSPKPNPMCVFCAYDKALKYSKNNHRDNYNISSNKLVSNPIASLGKCILNVE